MTESPKNKTNSVRLTRFNIQPMHKTMCAAGQDATEENTGRTFEHMGHTRTLDGLQYSDECIAHTIRMLDRNDWHHEAKACMARDRILCLTAEKKAMQDETGSPEQAAGILAVSPYHVSHIAHAAGCPESVIKAALEALENGTSS